MKKYIFKTIVFLSPILILHLFNSKIKYENIGDLTRIGNIRFDNKFTKTFLFKESKIKIKYIDYTKSKLNDTFSILTIGDSFNNQNEIGYNNYLAQDHNYKVLHYDGPLKNNNQIQTLIGLINGNIFDSNKIKYVLLENIERQVIDNTKNIDFNYKINRNDIIHFDKNKRVSKNKIDLFPKNTAIKITLNTFKYFISNQSIFNKKVYKVALTDNFFTSQDSTLLFYFYDLTSTQINNNINNIVYLNKILNDIEYNLNKKGVKLIYLPCSDKYDFYYNYIKNNDSLKKPQFFDLFVNLKHNFIVIDSKCILTKEIKKQKDLYFYEDTHWSPNATKLIAKEISKIIM
jgi:hypothetical protein